MLHERVANPNDLDDEPGRSSADPLYDPGRRATEGLPFALTTRIASGDRNISTAGRIINISRTGATVEVMFPTRGPSVIMLFDHRSDQVYECEVRWRTDEFIGVRFLDILGSGRRRLFFADQPVPLRSLPNEIMRLAARPREDDPSALMEPRWRAADRPAEQRRIGLVA